jgi:hypothetical protein
MPLLTFDLEDEKPPISFTLRPEDFERFREFLADCHAIKERAADVSNKSAEIGNLVTLICRLSLKLRDANPKARLPDVAMDYLARKGLKPNPLRGTTRQRIKIERK